MKEKKEKDNKNNTNDSQSVTPCEFFRKLCIYIFM